MLRATSAIFLGVALCCLVTFVSAELFALAGIGLVEATSATQEQSGDQRIVLRSFFAGSRGSVVVPGSTFKRGRLIVSGMPQPRVIDKNARFFVVWAVAQGGAVRNLGIIHTNTGGNGSMEFDSPATFDRYSVILTAEASPNGARLVGVPVLASRAGELRVARVTGATAPPPYKGASCIGCVKNFPNSMNDRDFYREIDQAISRGPTLLYKEEGKFGRVRGRGLVEVTSREGEYIIRARFTGLPPPLSLEANSYHLWAVSSKGAASSLGSLPGPNLNESMVYIRAPQIGNGSFALVVTAESSPNAVRPSGREIMRATAIMRPHHRHGRLHVRRRQRRIRRRLWH